VDGTQNFFNEVEREVEGNPSADENFDDDTVILDCSDVLEESKPVKFETEVIFSKKHACTN